MSTVHDTTSCPECGFAAADRSLNYHSGEENISCPRCGYSYQYSLKAKGGFSEKTRHGYGAYIINTLPGIHITGGFSRKMDRQMAEKWANSAKEKGVNISILTIREAGAVIFLYGSEEELMRFTNSPEESGKESEFLLLNAEMKIAF